MKDKNQTGSGITSAKLEHVCSFREGKEWEIMYQNFSRSLFIKSSLCWQQELMHLKRNISNCVHSKYDHKEFDGVLEKENSISFSEFHVSVFKGERVAFHSCKMSQYPGKKGEGEKLSLQTGIVQKSRDFQGHKHRYAWKVKNNGFRSWSCSLVMTFFYS